MVGIKNALRYQEGFHKVKAWETKWFEFLGTTILIFYRIQWRACDAFKREGDFHPKESQNSGRHYY